MHVLTYFSLIEPSKTYYKKSVHRLPHLRKTVTKVKSRCRIINVEKVTVKVCRKS